MDCPDASQIVAEIESLRHKKSVIEERISVLEAQLQDTNLRNEVSSCDSCSPTSVLNSNSTTRLSPDMIYRYSRQLLLPSFGVEGFALNLFSVFMLFFLLRISEWFIHFLKTFLNVFFYSSNPYYEISWLFS